MTRDWLLGLGSNLDSDAYVRDALACLADLGPTTALTPIQQFPSDDGGDAEYFNVLVTWQREGERASIIAQLKQIELALGRDHSEKAQVTIDIDLLAERVDDCWQASPHALEKNEFGHATVAALLRQAGVVVIGAARNEA